MSRIHHSSGSDARASGVVDTGDGADEATDVFLRHRNLLFTVAYEMLGSAADAEDVVQEAWLRWVRVDLSSVRDRRAYLVRVAARGALQRLRTLKRRRESYVGPWLPEPLLTTPDVAEDVTLAESVSMAMLVVMEALSPIERAVFVLREVFVLDHAEIARIVDRTPTAVRQLSYRARRHVAARRPREPVTTGDTRAAMAAFRQAVETGDLQQLLDLLAPDVVFLSDGGGITKAALQPIIGATPVAELLGAGLGNLTLRSAHEAQVNGHPALILRLHGQVDGVVTAHTEGGLITELYTIRNPHKLTRLQHESELRRC